MPGRCLDNKERGETMDRIQDEAQQVSAGVLDISAHIEFIFNNPAITTDDVRRMCEAGKNKKLAAICVPQWLVAYAKEQLLGTNVKVSTPVSLPGGISATAAKYAEVKEAVKNGADEVDIPMNMDLLKKGDYIAVRKDLEEAIMPAKGKACVKVVVESGISRQQMMAAIDIIQTCGVSFLTVSTISARSMHGPEQVEELADLCGGAIKLKLMGNIKDNADVGALVSAGVYRIGTSNIGVLL